MHGYLLITSTALRCCLCNSNKGNIDIIPPNLQLFSKIRIYNIIVNAFNCSYVVLSSKSGAWWFFMVSLLYSYLRTYNHMNTAYIGIYVRI